MTTMSRIEDIEAEVPLSRRAKLDQTFKPIFEKHEETGGIPLNLLHTQLEKYKVEKDLPPGGLAALLKRADEDHDGVLDYVEFIRLVTETAPDMIKPKHLSRFNRALRGAVRSVVPFGIADDYMEHYNCKPPPLFMILVSVVEVVIFIYYYNELKDTDQPVTANSGVPLYGPFIFNPSRRYEVWRYLTYMLIHRGYIHLISNLIFQLLIGLPLEMVHKWYRLGTVYILGVIAGSMASSVTDPYIILCGASGGCYALIGAHFAIVIMNWKEMTHNWHKGIIKTMCSAPMRLILWTLFASFDIGMAMYNRYGPDHKTGGVSYAAHIGGAVAGLLVGIPVLKNIDVKPWEKIVFWISLAVYILAVCIGIGYNLLSTNYPGTDWRPCCPAPKYS